MSPEQARRRKVAIDHRTDVYSLGATLYEFTTGRPPYRGKDHADTLSQIIDQDPVSPSSINGRLPEALETIALKSLRKDPDDRYGTAEALEQDLRRFVRGDPIEARPEPRWERWVRRLWRVRNRALVGILAVISVAASIALFVQYRRGLRASAERAYREEVTAGVLRLQLGEMTAKASSGQNVAISPEGLFRDGDLDALAVPGGSGLNPIEEALVRLSRAIELVPSRPEAFYHRARGLALLDRRAEALEDLDRAIDVATHFVPASALRSQLLSESGSRIRGRVVQESATPAGWTSSLATRVRCRSGFPLERSRHCIRGSHRFHRRGRTSVSRSVD